MNKIRKIVYLTFTSSLAINIFLIDEISNAFDVNASSNDTLTAKKLDAINVKLLILGIGVAVLFVIVVAILVFFLKKNPKNGTKNSRKK